MFSLTILSCSKNKILFNSYYNNNDFSIVAPIYCGAYKDNTICYIIKNKGSINSNMLRKRKCNYSNDYEILTYKNHNFINSIELFKIDPKFNDSVFKKCYFKYYDNLLLDQYKSLTNSLSKNQNVYLLDIPTENIKPLLNYDVILLISVDDDGLEISEDTINSFLVNKINVMNIDTCTYYLEKLQLCSWGCFIDENSMNLQREKTYGCRIFTDSLTAIKFNNLFESIDRINDLKINSKLKIEKRKYLISYFYW